MNQENFTLFQGDSREVIKQIPDNSIDSVVTDPPYGLNFMGKYWDTGEVAFDPKFWEEVLRVLKPGGHLLAFCGARTYHRLAVAIEDAGFEIRDQIMWLYGNGFPKSHDVAKAIDKANGIWRGRAKGVKSANGSMAGANYERTPKGAPVSDEARQWSGWGTALKPSFEPIVLARKPLAKGRTVAANVLEYGTGALNIDGCKVGDDVLPAMTAGQAKIGTFERGVMVTPERTGRWPANVIHDGSEEVVSLFPTENGKSTSRFFYCPKASKTDRNDGLDETKINVHPTVKPTKLMQYLCRLVTPPGGTILDPFTGSGSTGRGAILEGFRFVGIERDPEYIEIAESRIRAVSDNHSENNTDTVSLL